MLRKVNTCVPAKPGRLQQWRSWIFRACLAVSEVETMTVGTFPSFRSMTGPYFFESLHRDWCGNSPIWCKLPMIGKPGGDGGLRWCSRRFLYLMAARRRKMRNRSERSEMSTIFLIWCELKRNSHLLGKVNYILARCCLVFLFFLFEQPHVAVYCHWGWAKNLNPKNPTESDLYRTRTEMIRYPNGFKILVSREPKPNLVRTEVFRVPECIQNIDLYI